VAEIGGANQPLDPVQATRVWGQIEVAKRLVYVLYILAAWAPLQAMSVIAANLAGKQTNFTVSVTATLTISVVLGGTVVVQFLKNRAQGRELARLRTRIDQLEAELEGRA
jgi:cell division protein FtsB